MNEKILIECLEEVFDQTFSQKVWVLEMFCFNCGGREFEVDGDHCHCKNCGYVQYYAYASVGC